MTTHYYLAADLHLGRRVRKTKQALRFDSYDALDRLRNVLLADTADQAVLVLAGDLFDRSEITAHAHDALCAFTDELYQHNMRVFFVQGNHDNSSEDGYTHGGNAGCIPLHGGLTDVCGLSVYGLDWQPREQLRAAITEVPPCDLLVLHCPMEHLLGFEGSWDLAIDDIPPHVQHVLVGDVHIADKHQLPSGGWCFSSGSLHPCTLAESGKHGCWRFDGTDAVYVEIPTRDIIRLELRTEADVDAARATLSAIPDRRAERLEPFVDLRYLPALAQVVDERLGSFFLRAHVLDSYLSSGFTEEAQTVDIEELDPRDALPLVVDRKAEPEVFGFIDELLSLEPDSAVARINTMVENAVERLNTREDA